MKKKRIAAALSGLAIAFGGVAVSAPTAAAAPTTDTSAYAVRVYDMGVYAPLESCVVAGAAWVAYYQQQGYGARFGCVFEGGLPPASVYRLLLTLYI